jgi:hypothetical protein
MFMSTGTIYSMGSRGGGGGGGKTIGLGSSFMPLSSVFVYVEVYWVFLGYGSSSKRLMSSLSSGSYTLLALIASGLQLCLKNLSILELSVTSVSSLPLVRWASKMEFPFPLGNDYTPKKGTRERVTSTCYA